jgi:DNA-binding beta-propeller fold protein YncE
LRNRWFAAAGLFWAIEFLFFTTFLTNGQGIGTGLIGSLGYWIDQQEVMRGGQPWYYFWLLVPLYEFLPLVLSIGGGIAWLVSGLRSRSARPPGPHGMAGAGGYVCYAARAGGDKGTGRQGDKVTGRPGNKETGRPEDKGTGRKGDKGTRGVPASPPPRVTPGPHVLAEAGASEVAPVFTVQQLFDAFLVFWVLGTWAVFTYVGEKMAWHVTYFATPMALLGGWWLGGVVGGIDWRAGRERGLLWLMGMVPLFLIVLKALLPTPGRQPFTDVTVSGLSNSAQWLLALVVGLVLLYFLYERVVALGWRQSLRAVAVSLAALLAVFTGSVAFRFAYINYDYAIEPMVYAHATPDIKLAMSQIEEISRKTVGDHALRVAYDDDATWPLEWYLRDYPNKVYYAASPSRDSMDSPVVIAGDKNLSKVRPYLGDRYYEFNYRLIWWPKETYKHLSWQRIWDGIRDPVQRGQFWDVVIHRRYTTPTERWDPIRRFSMFVRKDVAAQVWDWGAAPGAVTEIEAAISSYEAGRRQIAALQQLGITGVAGSAVGQFSFPRAVAVDDEGRIYVADSGNNRVQVFNPDGSFLRQWGSTCKLDTREGCQPAPAGSPGGDGQGQFNEPWGIAVDRDGNVYVSDTWNHRIQKFDGQGNFLTMWGRFDSTGGELGTPGVFYGPRSLAIGQDGNLYVMDTGNKRVQVFTPDGAFFAQYGGGGVIEGRFDEPVGLGQDAAGNWYIADTWNRRIQKFDRTFRYLAQWPVYGWASQSVVNKPALAVDGARNIVYVVDPENYRVLAFDIDGNFRATFGLYGNDAQSFTMPTGIAVGPDGRVYVADGDSHRIMIFPPLQ